MVRTITSTSITLTQWAEESRSCTERWRIGQGIMIQIILVLPGALLQQHNAVLTVSLLSDTFFTE